MKKRIKTLQIDTLSLIMTIYVIVVLSGMLLVYHDFYYDILETKYTFYSVCTIIMLISVIVGLYFIAQPLKISNNLSFTDFSVILWGIFIVLATIFSPEKKLAFWGRDHDTGRYTGCFLLLLYVVSYFCITKCYKARIWHIYPFLIAGIVMCLLGITDFFDMDLLHFKEEISERQRYIFTSTIGNINTYTSCVAMIMAVFAVFYGSSKDLRNVLIFGTGTIISYVALILGGSDNAYLSLTVFFGILPFYLFRVKGGIYRYFILMASFFTVLKAVLLVQSIIESLAYPVQGLFQVIAEHKSLTVIIVIIWLIALAAYLMEYKIDTQYRQRLVIAWCILMLTVCSVLAFLIYDVNIIGNRERYGGIGEYLLFNDQWGTHRGYIWRIAVEDYLKFPLLQKIFGYGPDTFGSITLLNNYPEMVERYSEIFDSVHNEYLQYWITIGPFGLLSYLLIHISAAVRLIKKRVDNPLTISTFLAVLCYTSQAAVNINQPIATPIMWTLLSICTSSL